MEPAAQQRDDFSPWTTSTPHSPPQWSPPLSSGMTLQQVAVTLGAVLLPQWSPPLSSGMTLGRDWLAGKRRKRRNGARRSAAG